MSYPKECNIGPILFKCKRHTSVQLARPGNGDHHLIHLVPKYNALIGVFSLKTVVTYMS